MVSATVTVEYHFAYSRLLGFLAEGLTKHGRSVVVRLQVLIAQFLGDCRYEDKRLAFVIINRLGVDVFVAEVHAQTWARIRAHNFFADTPAALLFELSLLLDFHFEMLLKVSLSG